VRTVKLPIGRHQAARESACLVGGRGRRGRRRQAKEGDGREGDAERTEREGSEVADQDHHLIEEESDLIWQVVMSDE